MERNYLRQKQTADMIDLILMMGAVSAGMLLFFYIISKIH